MGFMASMRSILLGGAGVVAALVGASAAELPNMKHAHAERYKTCTVGGMTGFLIPGSDTCMKVSGYITGGVEAGNLKQQAAGSHN